MAIFLLLPLDYSFSGAYIKFTVSIVPSDWEYFNVRGPLC
jgi:hypothetical protein